MIFFFIFVGTVNACGFVIVVGRSEIYRQMRQQKLAILIGCFDLNLSTCWPQTVLSNESESSLSLNLNDITFLTRFLFCFFVLLYLAFDSNS